MSTDADEMAAAVNAAISELTDHHRYAEPPDPDEELLVAGDFAARFGTLGDFYEEPYLSRVQFWTGQPGAAFGLLGHWSVERGDPCGEPHPDFEEHVADCRVCSYLEDCYGIRTMFEFELCHECGLDIDDHVISPDPIGKAHAWCATPFERQEPDAGQGGDAAEYQISDAWNARWVAPLADGTYAIVTRTYYIGQIEEGDGRIEGVQHGVPFVERQDEYLICTDPSDPGGTESGPGDLRHHIEESDDPGNEDPHKLAVEAFPPNADEWRTYVPDSPDFAPAAAE